MSNPLLLRRRAMMAGGGIEPASDGRIWAYYEVTNTENQTTILTSTTNVSDVEIDGLSVGVVSSYTFGTTGTHLVKITLIYNTYIALNQFLNRTELVEIYIPSSIYYYYDNAFNGCENAVFHFNNRNITIKDNTTVFNSCRKLDGELIISSDSTARLYNQCFTNTCIEKVVLTNVTLIRQECFYGCKNLSYFEASEDLSSIDPSALSRYGVTIPTTYVFRRTIPPGLSPYNFNYTMNVCKIYVPYSADHSVIDAYKAANKWSNVASYIFELDENGEIPS